jgi:hypothetical protein
MFLDNNYKSRAKDSVESCTQSAEVFLMDWNLSLKDTSQPNVESLTAAIGIAGTMQFVSRNWL